MVRAFEHRVRGANLDDLAQIHHRNARRDVPNDGQIVRYEYQRELSRLLDIDQQVDDLGLHRNVECGNRFVANDKIGLKRQSARDAHALALAAGEFVRMPPGIVGAQTDLFEKFADPLCPLAARQGVEMDSPSFGDGLADREARIEGKVRILKHHLHAPTQALERSRIGSQNILAIEESLARGGGM